MECIICKEAGSEQLFDNYSCECKYKRHNSCWIDYVNSSTTIKCVLCRKDITTKKNKTPLPSAPPTPSSRLQPPSNPQNVPFISYQQTETFEIPIEIPPEVQNRPSINVPRPRQQTHREYINSLTPAQKVFQLVVLLGIITFLVLLFKFLIL